MSKSEEKTSKRKSKSVEDGSVTAEPKARKEKKDKKEKKSKKIVKSDEAVPIAEASTEDVEMKSEDIAPATEAIPAVDGDAKEDEPKSDENLLEIDPDAPTPLSKAQARAARKEAKLKRKAGNTSDDDEASDGEPKAKRTKKDKTELPKPPKRQHSVWIGNLAFKTNPESLKAWLEREIILLSKGGGGKPAAGEEEDDDEPEEGDDDEVDEETEIVTRVNMPMKQGRFGVQNQG
jgi:hypothetical protein